ncbi:ASCH domain-containing protein [Enterobacter hormaechei]|uniref:hypothetical protein n=1 Tax=Enterobacter hormaechei TaxID=158836 RepID=UPI001D00BA99|nr:hypothetical protein [Enterobacter hormaechei]
MKERGMIFNGEMVRAILDGRKTQTRRIIKPQPVMYEPGQSIHVSDMINDALRCPFGQVGNRIWVRETWAEAGAGAPDLKLYRADYPEHVPTHYENVPPADEIRWTPSIHMPRWASRLTLEITGVRVERLRDLSEVDAKSEGITPPSGGVIPGWEYRINFRDLWMSIYGADNWETNPWVWVIEFKVVPNVQDNPA